MCNNAVCNWYGSQFSLNFGPLALLGGSMKSVFLFVLLILSYSFKSFGAQAALSLSKLSDKRLILNELVHLGVNENNLRLTECSALYKSFYRFFHGSPLRGRCYKGAFNYLSTDYSCRFSVLEPDFNEIDIIDCAIEGQLVRLPGATMWILFPEG
jgi:hypothetical protein